MTMISRTKLEIIKLSEFYVTERPVSVGKIKGKLDEERVLKTHKVTFEMTQIRKNYECLEEKFSDIDTVRCHMSFDYGHRAASHKLDVVNLRPI